MRAVEIEEGSKHWLMILLKEVEEKTNMEAVVWKWAWEFFFLEALHLKSPTLGSSSGK